MELETLWENQNKTKNTCIIDKEWLINTDPGFRFF